MADKARECALHTLRRVWSGGAYSNIELGTALNRYGLFGVDRAFCVALVNTAIERQNCLDFLIEHSSGRAVADIDSELLAVLRLGMAQLFYMKVPDMAACNESAALVKNKSRRGFVNAVMRSACRCRERLTNELSQADGYIKVSLSPQIYSLIKSQYPDVADEIAEAFYGKNALCLRANTLRISATELAARLAESGAEAKVFGKAVLVRAGADKALAAVADGLAIVQGLSSQEAVEALEVQPGQTVVDVCACPGGKTLGAAMNMGGVGKIVAMDLHGGKLSLIEKSALSLGIDIIETREHDGKSPCDGLLGCADRVICDVPCSGIGAIKGRPEIRYKNLDTVDGLIETQRAVLSSAWCYLKEGGRLVYSTCTINKNENEGVVLPFSEKDGVRLLEMKTILPTQENKDGFFIAVLEKALE